MKIDKAPNSIKEYIELAKLYLDSTEYDSIQRPLSSAIKLIKAESSYESGVKAHYEDKDTEKALELYKECLNHNNFHSHAYTNMGVIYYYTLNDTGI